MFLLPGVDASRCIKFVPKKDREEIDNKKLSHYESAKTHQHFQQDCIVCKKWNFFLQGVMKYTNTYKLKIQISKICCIVVDRK